MELILYRLVKDFYHINLLEKPILIPVFLFLELYLPIHDKHKEAIKKLQNDKNKLFQEISRIENCLNLQHHKKR